MYNVRWLARVARAGLADLLPALRAAFNRRTDDDRLALVYGAHPRRNVVLLAVGGIVAGGLIGEIASQVPLSDQINWPAVGVGALFAAIIRRYLFATEQADVDDFPWLAASLAPAVVLLMALAVIEAFVAPARGGGPATSATALAVTGRILIAVTNAIEVAAALTIAVAALCFSRRWLVALKDLAVRLFVFRLMVWVTALVMLEIGIVGRIVGGILSSVFGVSLPPWLTELMDQVSYAVLMSVVYLAVIGATWRVCRRSFARLLESGQVNVLETVAAMASNPAGLRKKRQKAARKARRKARRRAG